MGDEDYTPPQTDDRNEELGIICEAVFNLTGTFVAGTPGRPADVTGCWPVGEWTFTAQLENQGRYGNRFTNRGSMHPDPLRLGATGFGLFHKTKPLAPPLGIRRLWQKQRAPQQPEHNDGQ